MTRNDLLLSVALALSILVAAPAAAFAACGDGAVDRTEQCDDGNRVAGDCCSPDCAYETNGASCTPSDACYEDGTCDDGECTGGAPVVCDDGDPCTSDSCDSEGQGCVFTGIVGCCTADSECDDGILCNGQETCTVNAPAETGTCDRGTPVACTDEDPCTRDACDLSEGRCVFTPDEAEPGCVAEDADGDGIWDRLDSCPDTPAGVTAGTDGCAAGDLAENPTRLINDSDRAYEKLVSGFLSPQELARERKLVGKIRKQLEKAAIAVAGGRSCTASKQFLKAIKHNENVLRSLHRRQVLVLTQARRSPAAAGDGGDYRTEDFASGYFEVASLLVQNAAEPFVRSSVTVDGVCRIAVPETLEGIVAEVSPTRSRLLLTDGTIVRTAGTRADGAVAAGAGIKIRGELVGDGDLVAGGIVADKPKLELAPFDISQCFDFMIAPVQPESDLDSDPLLTPLDGYRFEGAPASGRLYLEHGMALYVKKKPCIAPGGSPDPQGNYIRYSANFTLNTKAFLSNNTVWTTGYDVGGDQWWKIPDFLNGQGEMVVRWYARECNVVSNPPCADQLAPSTKKLREDTYNISVTRRGYYCQADYETTEYSLPDLDPDFDKAAYAEYAALFNQFAPAKAVSTSGSVVAMGGTRSFGAMAYRVTGPSTSSYPNLQAVGQNEEFAIFPTRDPFWNSADDQGVDSPVGVAWPHVAGERNGEDYQYACLVPPIVRDVVDFCAQAPNSYYRLPYDYILPVKCGQGNDSDFTHCGDNYPYDCSQKYAFDFSVPEYKSVVAARGGTVLGAFHAAKNSCSDKNVCSKDDFYCCIASAGGGICRAGDPGMINKECHAHADCGAGGECRCVANGVSVLHADGTVGQYFHMLYTSVFVKAGDRVFRGKELGWAGNTGCSTGTHVHFHTIGSAAGSTVWERATQPLRFQTADGTCVVPATNSSYKSNNEAWNAQP